MSASHLVGYARVSTAEHNPAAQLDVLKAAGCGHVFVESASGAQRDRPELAKALDYMRKGDVLVVWRLDPLARSVRQLVDTAGRLGITIYSHRDLEHLLRGGKQRGRVTRLRGEQRRNGTHPAA